MSIHHYVPHHIHSVINILAQIHQSELNLIINLLKQAKNTESTIYLFGNGGSHATASHFANDLLKVCDVKALCISDMTPTMLAYMNDLSPEYMFSSILKQFLKKNDVMIAFSCSGNSKNVVHALSLANDGVKRVLFTGDSPGKAVELADIVLNVPDKSIFVQESVHSVICHAITEALRGE